MSYWKTFIALFFATLLVTEIVFRLVERNVTSYTRAAATRLHMLIRYNLLFLLVSIFISKRISALVEAHFGVEPKAPGLPKNVMTLQHVEKQRKFQRVRRITSSLVILFLLCVHVSYFLYYFQPAHEDSIYAWICWTTFVCLGAWTYLGGLLIGFSIVNFVVRMLMATQLGRDLCAKVFYIPGVKTLLTNSARQTLITLCVTLFFVVFGLWVGTGAPSVKRVSVQIKGLPSEFDGFRIALLSDLHVGPSVGRSRVIQAVDVTNKLKPDLVAIVGDLVDGSVDQLRHSIEPIGYLRSEYGVYFSAGNHEYYYGSEDEWERFLASLGIVSLRNNATIIHRKKAPRDGKQATEVDDKRTICVAGVDDLSSEQYSIPGHGLNLRDGHTHGGQAYITAPLMYLLMPYFAGLYHPKENVFVYVSTGVFYFASPLKMAGSLEVTEITLRAATA